MTYQPFDLLSLEELPTYVPSRTTRADPASSVVWRD